MNNRKRSVPLNIELTDIITPKSCSCFIAELIKYVVYNKEQIPYPFEHLKMFVLKRRERQKIIEQTKEQGFEPSVRVSFVMEKYYKKIENAFEILNNTFKCIEQKLLESNKCSVAEIVLLFGATPVSPKDIYRIQIPSLSFGHSEGVHVWRKQIANLFREIIISEEVNSNIHHDVGLTNMFVMIKAHKGGYVEGLLPKDHYQLSERAQQVCFSFRSSIKEPCSCPISYIHQLETSPIEVPHLVLCDESTHSNKNSLGDKTHDQFMWFQLAGSLKGFRDCKSEGKSVIDLWHKHRFI